MWQIMKSEKRKSNDKELIRKHKLFHPATVLELKKLIIMHRYSLFAPNLSTEVKNVKYI